MKGKKNNNNIEHRILDLNLKLFYTHKNEYIFKTRAKHFRLTTIRCLSDSMVKNEKCLNILFEFFEKFHLTCEIRYTECNT